MKTLNTCTTAGIIILLLCTTSVLSTAQTFETLASFGLTNGATPEDAAVLVQGFDGNLYGTTGVGGAFGYGTVIKVTPSGTLAALYNFCSQKGCADGLNPSSLVLGMNGDLYGTTLLGGLYDYRTCGGNRCGTIFRISPQGKLTTIYNFCAVQGCPDGAVPGALIQASDGNFYGSTYYGGTDSSSCDGTGCGTIFEMTPEGKLTTLYSFCPTGVCTEGLNPYVALLQATNDNLYGTTYFSGQNYSCCGDAFEITPEGAFSTIFFFGYPNGSNPGFPLIQASNGDLYGTTFSGGYNNLGTVFEMTLEGAVTTLHSFSGTDGEEIGALLEGTDGNFYGAAIGGGAYNHGTLFKITGEGALTTLYNFCAQTGCTDGSGPASGLTLYTNGVIYGMTAGGGTNACYCGTIFSLSVGFGPFVKVLPALGKVGSPVVLLGNELDGATSVSFNGTPATFTVASDSAIRATVPVGATSGKIEVATPNRLLKSNVAFHVVP